MPRRTFAPYPFEIVAVAVARLLYRVRSRGAEGIPAVGGALIVANHLSYADVAVLQLACPRPLRFMGYRGARGNGVFDAIFRLAGVIPISAQRPTAGMRAAVHALQAGELVCLFPEGEISRTGQLMEIKKGFEVLARHAGVPVIPAAIDGLWGSSLSFAGRRYFSKAPRLLPTPVFVAFGSPIPPEQAGAAAVRRALLDLGAEAFEERPVLRRHLGREIVRALAKKPGRIAVVDRTAGRREVNAAQLLAAVGPLARRWRATIPEKRVGIVLPPGAGGFIANLAVLCAGKVPVNLNFTAGRPSLEASIARADIKTVISAEAMRAKAPNFPWPGDETFARSATSEPGSRSDEGSGTRKRFVGEDLGRTLDLREEIAAAGGKRAMFPWLVAAWLLPNPWVADLMRLPRVGDRAEAGLLFTSGSSGEPKGVVLTHRNILANCSQVSSLSILPRSCTLLGCLPLFHSFGFTVTLWYPLLRGCRLVTVPSPLDTRKIIDAIRDEEVSVLLGAPTFLRPMLKKVRPGELRSLDLVVTGAEKLPDDLYRSFLASFHLEILQGYGLTETSPVSSVNQHHPPITTATAGPQVGKKVGTVGRLLPGMTVRIVDPETGRDLPATETGMVWLRGANVFPGYLEDRERTEDAFRDDVLLRPLNPGFGGQAAATGAPAAWFVTGDLGRFDDDGFLTIEGRLSRFSKIAGEMVPHGRVEQAIAEAFDFDQSEGPAVAVMGVHDAAKGEALVVLTVREVTAESIREKLAAASLPNLWIPRIVKRVEKIPVLGTGKLDLNACQRLAQ